jgi:hypothetical protein
MANEYDIYKSLGLKPEDCKGKTEAEIMDLILLRASEQKESILASQEKLLIENAKTQLSKLKEQFEKPFEIFAKTVGQKKSLTKVKVVGYNATNKTYIVITTGEKTFSMSENDVITSESELKEAKEKQK